MTSEFGIFFKNLFVRIYGAECTENIMGGFGPCLNVKLSSAWRLTPVREAQGASPHFGIGHENVFFCRTIRPIRIKFGMGHQSSETLSFCVPLLDPPLQSGWWTILTPECDIIFKSLFVRNHESDYTKIIMGASRACLNVKFGLGMAIGHR